MNIGRIVVAGLIGTIAFASSAASEQTVLSIEKVRELAWVVALAGYECEGVAGKDLGELNGTRVYRVDCRDGERFVCVEKPGGEVFVKSCTTLQKQGYVC